MGDTDNEHCHYLLCAGSWRFDLHKGFFFLLVVLTAMKKVPMSN